MRVKKYIEIPEEILVGLLEGKFIEGSLHRDKDTGRIVFNAYNRKPCIRHKDKLIKKLPWGWVKKSKERVKVYGSFPEDLGTAKVICLLDEHTREAKNALIENELIEFC